MAHYADPYLAHVTGGRTSKDGLLIQCESTDSLEAVAFAVTSGAHRRDECLGDGVISFLKLSGFLRERSKSINTCMQCRSAC